MGWVLNLLDVEFGFPEVEPVLPVQVAHKLIYIRKLQRGLVGDLETDHADYGSVRPQTES